LNCIALSRIVILLHIVVTALLYIIECTAYHSLEQLQLQTYAITLNYSPMKICLLLNVCLRGFQKVWASLSPAWSWI